MNSQSQSSQNTPKVPSLSKASSLNEESIKQQSKKASSVERNSVNTNEIARKSKVFRGRKEMQESLGNSISLLNETLYQRLWANSIGSAINLFWQKKPRSNIKMGQKFHLNAKQVNEVLGYLKNQMETSLQNQDMEKTKQQLEFVNKDNIIQQIEKSGYQGQIDLLIQDPQQPDLHEKICKHVQKMKQKGQQAWYIENLCQTRNLSQNEKCLFVFQLKRNFQLNSEKIPGYLGQIIKIAIATQELYLEKLIKCKVQRQIYYHQLFRTKESVDEILEKPKVMFYYVIDNSITKEQFTASFRNCMPILRHLCSKLGVVMNVIGYNPISPNQQHIKQEKDAKMEQLRKQIAQIRKEKAAQMEKQKEREAQMKAQIENLKEQLAFLMKDKSS